MQSDNAFALRRIQQKLSSLHREFVELERGCLPDKRLQDLQRDAQIISGFINELEQSWNDENVKRRAHDRLSSVRRRSGT